MKAAPGSWRKVSAGIPPELPERTRPCPHLASGLVRPPPHFRTAGLGEKSLCAALGSVSFIRAVPGRGRSAGWPVRGHAHTHTSGTLVSAWASGPTVPRNSHAVTHCQTPPPLQTPAVFSALLGAQRKGRHTYRVPNEPAGPLFPTSTPVPVPAKGLPSPMTQTVKSSGPQATWQSPPSPPSKNSPHRAASGLCHPPPPCPLRTSSVTAWRGCPTPHGLSATTPPFQMHLSHDTSPPAAPPISLQGLTGPSGSSPGGGAVGGHLRLECLSHRAAARMSQRRREPLLLL